MTPSSRRPTARRTPLTRSPDARHLPVRSCIGCRRRAPMPELVRCVLDADGAAVISRTADGRGAWLCRSLDCFDRAVRARRFDRAWRRPVTTENLDRLRSAFAAPTVDMRESMTGVAAASAPVKG